VASLGPIFLPHWEAATSAIGPRLDATSAPAAEIYATLALAVICRLCTDSAIACACADQLSLEFGQAANERDVRMAQQKLGQCRRPPGVFFNRSCGNFVVIGAMLARVTPDASSGQRHACSRCLTRQAHAAAKARAGGAMNSGPTGSLMVAARMRSISAIAGASSHHPFTSSTGCSWAGWRAPHKALVMP
jgi:hypothetical protein